MKNINGKNKIFNTKMQKSRRYTKEKFRKDIIKRLIKNT